LHRLSTALAIAVAVVLAAPVAAEGARREQKSLRTKSRPPVIIRDPSLYRPPPPPHERNYYGPAPTIQPPMQRVPLPAPLSQPPIR
jgi:hypothetical protein